MTVLIDGKSPIQSVQAVRPSAALAQAVRPEVQVVSVLRPLVQQVAVTQIVGRQGEQGVPGVQGLPGIGSAHVHTQVAPSATWSINPPPGVFVRRPQVSIFIGNEQALADVETYLDPVLVTITFAVPQSGQAILT